MEGGVPFFPFLLDFLTRESVREKRFFYTPGHPRASVLFCFVLVLLLLMLFCRPRFTNMGGKAALIWFLVD